MSIMDDDTLQMYIEESKEHLETIESDLLDIEQDGEDIDEELVNKVFRAAHSIKGGAGFLGLDNIKELSHKIENVLDLVRNMQMVPTPDVVNIVLVAFDRLGELMDDALNSNDTDIEGHVTALKKLASGTLDESEKDSVDTVADIGKPEREPYFRVMKFDIDQARKGGKTLYILEYDLIADVQQQNKTPLDVVKSLEDAGQVVDIQVGLASVGDLDSDEISPKIPLYILYASIIEHDLIGTILDLDQKMITEINKGEEQSVDSLEITSEEEGAEATIQPAVSTSEEQSESVKLESPQAVPAKQAPPPENEPAKTPPPKKAPIAKAASKPPPAPKSESLRVQISVLDELMNRAGELVLARNELLQAVSCGEKKSLVAAGQRINQVTSEIQDAIMLTRMQPVGNIFNKFTRVVRDLARDLSKEMDITLEGKEVELDKTIIEGLGDPLTHLVRNSCDHGIELPDLRAENGKPPKGSIYLRAFHESGQVIIEIEDDGKGLDSEKLAEKAIEKGLITEKQAAEMSVKEKTALIMMPGFSMAKEVTEVSGRGVGMDVVKTNLDKLGGEVELISELGSGTIVRIKLPLTLAIIPSLLVASCGERFAIPQVNVGELLRIAASELHEKIEKVGGADVLILRGELIPLLQLNNVLGLSSTYFDPKANIFRKDRRGQVADERLSEGEAAASSTESSGEEDVEVAERRGRRCSDVSVVVLQAGAVKFGLVVEEVHDTVEIVVKPLGRHLKNNTVYAGATIMGDGNVALILDVAGLGKKAELRALTDSSQAVAKRDVAEKEGAIRQTLLLFHNGQNEYCAVPLHLVLRVEQIKTLDIEIKGGKKVIQYRGGSLPIYALEEVANVDVMEEREELTVIIFVVAGHEIGLLAIPPLDVIEDELVIDEHTLKQSGISGSTIVRGETTLLVDIFDFMNSLNPEWFEQREIRKPSEPGTTSSSTVGKPILLAEDSMFFRAQVKQFLESEGHQVIDFEDGKEAWDYLNANPESIGLVITDLEMPNMDGFELTRNIKGDDRFSHLTVIALTSLAGEENLAKGKEVGIDDYQLKLDKEQLLQGIHKCLGS